MKNKLVWIIGMLFLLVGCCDKNYYMINLNIKPTNISDKDVVVFQYYKTEPTPTNTYVVCGDDQYIWDNRGSIGIQCKCDNVGCRDFPTRRICDVSFFAYDIINNKTDFIQKTIYCSEVIGRDRKND